MAAGYASSSRPPRKALLPFRIDDRLERLIEETAAGRITPTPELRMAVGHYKIAKDAARATRKESTR